MKLTSLIVCNCCHLIVSQECFVRDAVPTFILALVNIAPCLQRLLQKDTQRVTMNDLTADNV